MGGFVTFGERRLGPPLEGLCTEQPARQMPNGTNTMSPATLTAAEKGPRMGTATKPLETAPVRPDDAL
jgi:hypothetical protein